MTLKIYKESDLLDKIPFIDKDKVIYHEWIQLESFKKQIRLGFKYGWSADAILKDMIMQIEEFETKKLEDKK